MYLLEDPKVHVFRRDALMADTSVSRRKVATGKEDIKSAKIAKVAFAKTYSSCSWEMDHSCWSRCISYIKMADFPLPAMFMLVYRRVVGESNSVNKDDNVQCL